MILIMVLAKLALTVFPVCVQLKARDVAGQALSFIQDLVAALLNFHTYTEQRVHIYPRDSSIETISPLNQRVRHPHMLNTSQSIVQVQDESAGVFVVVSFFKCNICDGPIQSLCLNSFLSICMKMQPLCAPLRTASCSYTKVSQKTRSRFL